MKCGLLGRKLGHSYSPQIHSQLGSYDYRLFEKEPEELEEFLRNGDFTGINVTYPYKKSVIPYLNDISPIAARLGAVNTIVRHPDGRLIGHNTDYFGFQFMLRKSGLGVTGKKVLVLGSGGASNTVTAVLKEQGAQVVIISRSGENNYENLHLHEDAALIVNTTPVGMYPDVGCSPINLKQFPHLEGVLDVVYNPAQTQLLLDAEKRGIIAMNGLWMLVAQAKEAAEWFTDSTISDESIPKIHQKLKTKMENIVLIGMPGCGKSTVGAMLAEQLDRRLVDTDAEIIKLAGMSIPEIFARHGQSHFRQLEKKVIREYGKRSGLIIATGGGCVTEADNYDALHQNGRIFWLVRELEQLPTDGRPLSQAGKLEQLYHEREPLYNRFSDCLIDNNGAPNQTISQILSALEDT